MNGPEELFTIEAWHMLKCIAVRSVVRPATAVKLAEYYAIDRGAERVIVYRKDVRQPVAEWINGSWQYVKDDDLHQCIWPA